VRRGAALLSSILLSAAAAAGPLRVPYRRFVLDNGLTVILHEDHSVPIVGVNTWYRVGSANERKGRTGFAHLFEHLMFLGSQHVANGQFDRLLEEAGGDNNASTGNDRTNYYEVVPKNALELALWLDADRMATLGPTMTAGKIETEREVVKNERRESVENRPYGRTEETLARHLFPQGHPYSSPVIGSMEDLDAASVSDVREFFAQFYVPNNAILALAGDFPAGEAERLVRKYFSWIPRGPPTAPLRPPPVEIAGEDRIVLEDRVELSRLTLAWVTPARLRPGDAALDLAAEILSGDKTSRLYRRLVYETEVAQDVDAAQDSLALASIFRISATARPGHGLSEVERAIDEELARFRRDGPTPEELRKAKNVVEAAFLRRLERVGGFGGIADELAAYEMEAGEPDFFEQDLDAYRRVCPQDIAEAVRAWLPATHRVVLSVVPTGKEKLAARTAGPESPRTENLAENVDWKNPPAPGAPSDVALPPIVRSRLPNGLEVWVMEKHSAPIVRADVVVESGSSSDPTDEPGLADVTLASLVLGTKGRDALKVSSDANVLGAELAAAAGWDSSVVSLDVPSAHWGEGLDLLADVVLRPTFPEADLARLRRQRDAALREDLSEPRYLAERAFALDLYGPGHPYGRPPAGTLASIRKIDRRDVERSYERHFRAGSAAVVVVGDVEAAAAAAAVAARFGSWKGGTDSPPSFPARTPGPRILLVDKPGAAQSELRVGQVGVSRSFADYFPLEVMNTLLGGAYTSRLNHNLRERHGWAYGADSIFSLRRVPGPFIASAAVHTDATAPALAEMLAEIRRIVAEAPTEEELRRAKNSLALSLPQTLETPGQIADRLDRLFSDGRPADFYDRFVARVAAVRAEDVRNVARETIRPDRLAIVIVGDVAKIRPEIEKRNLGRVEVVRYDPERGALSAAGAAAGGSRHEASSSNSVLQK
jgi:zinc protease